MDIHRQVRYPAIARAQQMSAARLGVATPMARAGEERMQQRRVQNEDGAAEGGRQQGEGEAAATPSPWMSKRRDTLTAAVAAAAAAAVGKRFGGASAPPRSHDKRSNPTGDSLSAAKPTRTRTRTANGDTSTAAGSSPSGRRQSSAKRGRARGTVDVPGISSRFLSRSVSPLPVAKVRRGTSREAERRVSIEKTVADIVEISRSVRREAIALDRFLSLELERAAQEAFDAAVSEHAKACRILEGMPKAAFAPVADAVSGDRATSSRQQDRGSRGDNGSEALAGENDGAGRGDAITLAVHNSNANEGSDDTAASSAGTGAAAEGIADATSLDAMPETTPQVATATAVVPSDVSSTSVIAGATLDTLSSAGASDNPTEAWQRAVRAGVIHRGQPPPTHSSVRASLPAIATRPGGGAAAAIDRPPIVDFIGGVSDGGGGGSGCPLRSQRRRHRRTKNPRRGEHDAQTEDERVGEMSVPSKAEKEGAMREGGGAAGKNEDQEEDEDGERHDKEGDDDGWDSASLHGALQQLTTDISSKMVGLSSLIRGKAAKAAESEGRRKQ